MSDDEDKSRSSEENEEDDDEDQSEGEKSGDDDDDEEGSGSGGDDDEEGDDDDEDGSGSGSGDGSDKDEEGSDEGEDSDDDESSKKKKKDGKKKKGDDDDQIVPKDLKQKEGDLSKSEFQKIMADIGSLETDVDSFISTFSSETQQRIGFNPHKGLTQNAFMGQQTGFTQYGNTIPNAQSLGFTNDRSQGQYRPASPPRSPYNTYGAYRFQKEQSQNEINTQQQFFKKQTNGNPSNQYANRASLPLNQHNAQPLKESLLQTQQSPIARRGSLEDVAEMQAILAKQQNKQIEQVAQNYQSKSRLPQQGADQIQQSPNRQQQEPVMQQEYRNDDNYHQKSQDRFRINKESQSIIDNYYQNLYRKQAPLNRNYSNIDDLYKQRPKNVYDEDDLKRKSISPSISSKDQKFVRNTPSQQNFSANNQYDNQRIDQAIKVLLGKKQ